MDGLWAAPPKETASALVKDTLLLILFFLIILLCTIILLSFLRISVFLIETYDAAEGVKLSSVPHHMFLFLKDILPFAIIVTVFTLFIRMYKHPGIVWLSHLIIFGLAFGVWLGGFQITDIKTSENPDIISVGIFSPRTIHHFEEYELYVHDIHNDTLKSAVLAGSSGEGNSLQYISALPAANMLKKIAADGMQKDPGLIPSIEKREFFASALEDFRIFRESLFHQYSANKQIFYLLSAAIILLLTCSSILLKISRLPLFIIAVMIIFLRLYFYSYARFAAGVPGMIINTLLQEKLYPPFIFTCYLAVVFLFITLRYHIVHPPSKSGELI
jgi:hypothetical protein